MSTKYIKLTDQYGDPTWANIDRSIGMTRVTEFTTIHFGQNEYVTVTETPEQILAMINGDAE